MNFHGRIMNIPAEGEDGADGIEVSYLMGHRDARHAAAEIANEADEQIRELVEALKRSRGHVTDAIEHARDENLHKWLESCVADLDAIDAALGLCSVSLNVHEE